MSKTRKKKRLVDDLSFWDDQEGQAMTEFVICAPILLTIMVAIVWIFDYQDFHQDAIVKARNDTWDHVVRVDQGGGQQDSDSFPIPILDTLGINLGGLNTIRNAVLVVPPFLPSMVRGNIINSGIAWLGLCGDILGVNLRPMYETANLPVRNYHTTSGPAFSHGSMWNQILFAIGGIFDLVPGVSGAGSWPPPATVSFPNEHFPLVSYHWEAINHRTHNWDESFNLMRDRINGDGTSFFTLNGTRGLEVSSILTYQAMRLWFIVTAGRSSVFHFNRHNFDFVRDSYTTGIGSMSGISMFDYPDGFWLGDARGLYSDSSDGQNPLVPITGQSQIRQVILSGG
ncbi:TadE/TadG family type IV pilus assembly protein [Candidatus Sumerlaeota bacterium]